MFDLNTLGVGGLLYGRQVVELPTRRSPKLKISPDCPVSDEFRAEMNAWLVEQFGYRDSSIFQPGMAYLFGDTIAVHPADLARLRGI